MSRWRTMKGPALLADLILLGASPRFVAGRAFLGAMTDSVLARAPCAVAIYAGGVRPEALRATAPEPEPGDAGEPAS